MSMSAPTRGQRTCLLTSPRLQEVQGGWVRSFCLKFNERRRTPLITGAMLGIMTAQYGRVLKRT